MEFDEYDYLEKAVEGRDTRKEKDRSRSRNHREPEGHDDRAHKKHKAEADREGDRRDERERSERLEKHRRRSSRDEEERVRDSMRSSREREPELEREGRSSSRSRRHDGDGDMEKDRSRSRERARVRELERELRERERKSRERKESVEPLADPERDQRTVFAYQMPLRATDRDVYEFFSQVGKVRDVQLIMDRNSRRSKGVGYVEFCDVMTVPHAIALSGHLFLGQPIMVKPSEAEKNLSQSTTAGTGALGAAAERKIYVGNLHLNMNEQQLRQIFEAFGPVELVQLPLDLDTGHCRGYGFVQFAQLEHAKAAQSLNGKLEIAGRIIKVSAVTDHVKPQDVGTSAVDFDDEDGGNLSLDARSRASLMQKLDRTGTVTSIAQSLGVPILNEAVSSAQTRSLPINALMPGQRTSSAEPNVQPSECLLLKNMFDPNTEMEPDFDLEIKEDVQQECSKFGCIKHIYVDKRSIGWVYLRFDSVASAINCQRVMHGRWFAGRAIHATFMRVQEYEAKFGSGV